MLESEFNPDGLFDPVSCRNRRWTITRVAIMKGRMKWKAKNHFRLALSTESPPQIHSTKVVPIYGIADKRFVITVAPQDDNCPHGNTYPMNAVAITVNRRRIPMFHVSRNVYDP